MENLDATTLSDLSLIDQMREEIQDKLFEIYLK